MESFKESDSAINNDQTVKIKPAEGKYDKIIEILVVVG